MRNVRLINENRTPRLRSRLANAVACSLPHWAVRKLMERTFINFGVETTNLCNANCSFCGYRFMQRPKVDMPMEVYAKAVREYAANGGGNLNFTPTVGDPLVDKQLIRRIELARSYPEIQDIFLYTNAILLERFGYEALLQSGLSRLAISTFIGSREGYERYYGNDKYGKVVENIIEIARTNRKLGSPVRITLHLRVEGKRASWEDTGTYQTIAELVGVNNIDYLDVYDAWGGRIKKEDVPEGTELDEPIPLAEKTKSPCFEMYRRLHVLADGNVGACVCVDLESEIKVGNVKKQSLDEIWKGQRLRDYRSNWVKGDIPKVCQSCTRYQAVDQFIDENRKRVIVDFARRRFPATLKLLIR
jgi:radical SAM protein with 4Fe4S-binding SPASM domain